MESYVRRLVKGDSLESYNTRKMIAGKKEEISPWSFYQDQEKTFMKERREEKKEIPKEIIKEQKKQHTPPERKKTPTTKNTRIPQEDEETTQKYAQMKVTAREITEMLKERLVVKALLKYFDSEQLRDRIKGPSIFESKKPVAQININLNTQTSKQLPRPSQQLAFEEMQMQIHSIPQDLKNKLTKRRPSKPKILNKRDFQEELSPYADYNFKKSIVISGSRKVFSQKD